MAWQQLSVTVREASVSLVDDLLSALGAASVTFQDAADQPLYEPEPGEGPLWRKTKVTALFDSHVELAPIQAFVMEHLGDSVLAPANHARIEDQDWVRCWLDYFRPMKFGERLWVCPSGHALPESDATCMVLDPGLAFGTGTHPTTALCLQWLADRVGQDRCVIDYGCGSGILAIAAILLGAGQAFAVDIDSQALVAAGENAIKNNVGTAIRCCKPADLPNVQGDLVLANILAKPLIKLVAEIAPRVRAGGDLVLSGILSEQAENVQEAYRPYFAFQAPYVRDGWVMLHGVRNARRLLEFTDRPEIGAV